MSYVSEIKMDREEESRKNIISDSSSKKSQTNILKKGNRETDKNRAIWHLRPQQPPILLSFKGQQRREEEEEEELCIHIHTYVLVYIEKMGSFTTTITIATTTAITKSGCGEGGQDPPQ
ncbi:hypothetical protein B9Z55_026095 [Caenorhabditis nigoni]|uniref:Uncharacterized protein n=1 Tax=Caenorhabditis nigoni TaxID=1611254 RepID=A0A2G5T170_9PELO|nr:hypothetical protein B9Z55_026095 [Caenorhabditis nigoni]